MLSKKYLFLPILIFHSFILFSQTTLYTPLNFQDAFENKTRSADGKPGINYWQNSADYNITARVEPSSKLLTGTEDIIYYNNSPDTLNELVIRLYQNINKPGSMHDFPINEKEPSAGMVVTSLTVNNEEIDINDKKKTRLSGTNLTIKNIKIMPHQRANISSAWNFIIPKENGVRMGVYDSTSFFIAYWYPQVAVYDDIDGWDKVNYTGEVEFYNDFNNYEVNISVPNTMCIWATGMLKNAEEIMSAPLYDRYKNAMSSGSIVHIISVSDYYDYPKNSLFNKNDKFNRWIFNASNVPDFTFGLSDHYIWDGRNVSAAGKNVFVSAAYKKESENFSGVCQTAAETVDYLSKIMPAVAFPFPKISVYEGDDGMESPMMVNEGNEKEKVFQVYTTTHEVAHSYFPFYMGINERKYAWMDEGWAQYLSEPIQWQIDSSIDFRARDESGYTALAGQDLELPPMAISYIMKDIPYGNAAYFRSAAAYNTLNELLGEELFKKCLQEYIQRWNGKHPVPYDFFYTFNEIAGEDLSWFWKPWFFESGYPDLGVDTVITDKNTARVKISQEGNIPTSVSVTLRFMDGTEKNIFKNCGVWREIDELWIEIPLEGKTLKSVSLVNSHIPDAVKENDVWE